MDPDEVISDSESDDEPEKDVQRKEERGHTALSTIDEGSNEDQDALTEHTEDPQEVRARRQREIERVQSSTTNTAAATNVNDTATQQRVSGVKRQRPFGDDDEDRAKRQRLRILRDLERLGDRVVSELDVIRQQVYTLRNHVPKSPQNELVRTRISHDRGGTTHLHLGRL